MLYFSGLFLLVMFVYVPVAILILAIVARSKRLKGWTKTAAVAAAAILLYAIPLGDVTIHSINYARACKTVGVRIYKVVPVEGILNGGFGKEETRQYGYRFAESRGRYDKKVAHVEFKTDGTTELTMLDVPLAKYEVVYDQVVGYVEDGVVKKRQFIRQIETGEVTAERVAVRVLKGWVDRHLLGWFGNSNLAICGPPPEQDDGWKRRALPPKRTQ